MLQSEGYGAVRGMLETEFDRLEAEVERRTTVHTKQDDLLHLMAVKFKAVPAAVAARVRALQDTETLDRLLERLIHAENLQAMGL